MYLKILNQLLPNSSIKQFKTKILPELLLYGKLYPKGSTNMQVQTQVYFITKSISLINDHLTYMDEELALSLLNIVD